MKTSKKTLSILISTMVMTSNLTIAADWSIEEVVVTAQKRAQSAQDIGVAITAFSGDDIRSLGGGSPKDLAAQSPGLSATNAQSGGVPIFSLRGIGLDDFNINNSSSVGVYIDQVFASSPAFLSFQMLDVAAVEVLKGPQGTLYGKNTTGGAITFVSNKPTEEFEAAITASYGRFSESKLEGYVSGALSDNVRGRFALSTLQGGDYQEDIFTGKDYGDRDKTAFRGLLAIDLSESADVLLDIHGGVDKSTPALPVIKPEADLLGGSGNHDARHVESDVDVKKDDEGFGFAATLNKELGFATFTAIASYDEFEVNNLDNYGARALHIQDLRTNVEVDQSSVEFRLTSDDSNDFTWIAGLNYSEENSEGLAGTNPADVVEIGFGAIANDTKDDDYVDTLYDQGVVSLGLYGHTETQLNNEFKLTVGLRYSYDDVDYNSDVVDNGNYDFGGGEALGAFSFAPAGTTFASIDENHDEESITGKVALDYAPSDDWLFYASAATGYKGGRFYSGAVPTGQYLFYVKPEELTAFELGFKGTLLDGSLQINGATYQYDYEDRQSMILDDQFAVILANIPESELRGAELDFWWRPLEGLDLKGGIAYMDTMVTKGPTSLELNGLVPAGNVGKGSALSQAPEWSYNLVASYSWDLSSGLTARAQMDYSWKDEQLASVSDPQSGYGRVKALGVRFAVASADETWELALWGRNLTDENDATFAQSTFIGEAFQYLQKPATYGIEFTYNVQ